MYTVTMQKEISIIRYPNTVGVTEQETFATSPSITIKRTTKNGEMASIGWFEVYKEGELVAEIKESICNIYY
jgi:hypothetical protein